MTNTQIAGTFEAIGSLLSLLDENPFRIRAYQRAAQTIASLSEDMKSVYERGGLDALKEIPGIGNDLALKIEELVNTGALAYLAELQKKVPAGLIQITGIQGMGPKKTAFVWKKFKVTTVQELEKLAQSGKLSKEKGWGAKSVENIMEGIKALQTHGDRVALPAAFAAGVELLEAMRSSGLCTQAELAGSLRRRKETIGDIDILVSSNKPEEARDFFCALPLVERVLARGPTRASVRLSNGLNSDLRVIDADVFGAALHYFTGSKEHNIAIRKRGIERGLTISEYGVHKGTAEKKGKLLPSTTEADVYKAVDLLYIEPEMREDRGEIALAERGLLPELITVDDMKGDLHMHSTFSDGSAEMVDMARAAKKAGLQYIAICDHASPMGMVKGIKEGNIKDYRKLIEAARTQVKGMEIFAGAEVDIMQDGSLFLPDAALATLDWVVASVHGHFHQSSADMTKRLIRAIQNPHVRLIAHPTTRLLLKRDPIAFDADAVFAAAAKHGVAMEINASLERLDLNDVLARKAKEMGVMICIDSDAHHPREFDYRFGISQARRAWLEKSDVMNTMSAAQFKKFLTKRRT